MSDPKKSVGGGDGSYDVGYAKPPKDTRFATGRSGNPKGRAKGVGNFRTDVKATLKALVKVTRGGRTGRVTAQKAALWRMCEKALAGDARGLEQFLRLAQAHNNDDPSAATGLSTDDERILEIYRARVLSGAAAAAGDNKET